MYTNRDDGRIKRRVSYSKKVANNFERAKDIMDAYDNYYGYYRNRDNISKFDMNYDLFNGRLNVEKYRDHSSYTIKGEKIKLSDYPIVHYPLISQVANTMHGELMNRPFVASVADNSPLKKTLYTKQRNQLILDWFQNNIIAPAQNAATLEWMQRNNVQDVFSLSPEQQQEMQMQIQEQLNNQIPDDIINFMSNEFQSPTQKVLQKIMDAHVRIDDIVGKSHEGGKHAIITGREVYRIIEENETPKFDLINPKHFMWGGSQNTEWFQDGVWCRYEEWLLYEDLMQRFGQDLVNADIKQLEALAEPMGGFRDDPIKDGRYDNIRRATRYEISVNTDEYIQKYGEVNVKTKEGQAKMVQIMNNVANKYGMEYGYAFGNYGFRVSHFNWKDQRKLKRVSRLEDGEIRKYWLDETYEKQPEDIDIKEVWVNETWEGYKIGTTSDPIYTRIRRIPWQFTSINNPYTAELCYYGKDYNTHMNNSDNIAHIDRGKPWQLEFDTEMAALKHDLKTNVGKVFTMVMDMKPDNYNLQEWIDMIRNFHILPINPNKQGLNRIDPALIREVDLSKMSDISARIQLLEYAKNNMVQDMFFSQSRIGAVGQYATQANIQSNNSASFNQTENFFSTHRKIIDKALTGYLKLLRYSARKNPEKYENVLDDVSMAYLKTMPAWNPDIDVTVSGSGRELQELERLRQLMLSLTQNGMQPDTIVKLALADNKTDILDIIEQDKTERMEQMQQQQMMQQQMQQQQLQAQLQEKQMEQEAQYKIHLEKLRSQEERTAIDSLKFQKQADVDNNNMADTIEKAILELQAKERMHEKEMQRKDRELDIKEQQVRNKS